MHQIRCKQLYLTPIHYLGSGQTCGKQSVRRGVVRAAPATSSHGIGQQRQVPDGHEQACFSDMTLGEEADKSGVPWAYYAGNHTAGTAGDLERLSSQQHIYYGSDWSKDVISPPTQFFTDVSNGNLRQISWVTPTCTNSDHAGLPIEDRPPVGRFARQCIGQSKYWENTAIFIFWDDYGGWYDPEPPAYVDYDGLGMRVPMVIVSPYAKKGYVSHVHYEHGSILKFVEDQFGLGPAFRQRQARELAGERCLRLQKTAAPVQSDPEGAWQELFLASAARSSPARYSVGAPLVIIEAPSNHKNRGKPNEL